MTYILHLAGWYPSRVDPLSGDFVQRHAQSIALQEKVVSLFLIKDPSLPRNTIDVQRQTTGNLEEYIVYYSSGGPLGKGLSLFRYLSIGLRIIRQIKDRYGPPRIVHVNIPWKAGLLALNLKKKYGWKYLVTENWAGYTPDNPKGLHRQNVLIKSLYRRIFRNTSFFLPVSDDLARQVDRWFPGMPYMTVPNAVDTSLFYYEPQPPASVRKCIHVSTMGYQKNIEGILRVLDRLMTTRNDIEVTLVGPYTDAIRTTLIEKGWLDKRIFLTGPLTYPEVASRVRQSHVSFLFSRYENQPCVILEALCCGLPVIATAIGGIPEVIDATNGLLVPSEDEEGLLRAFHTILDTYTQYDRGDIAAAAAKKFSFYQVGRRMEEAYRKLSYPSASD